MPFLYGSSIKSIGHTFTQLVLHSVCTTQTKHNFFSSHPYSNFRDAECQKSKNHQFWHCPIANLRRYHDKIKHNMGMERDTTIILVSTDSALIRQYKLPSLKKCKLYFTYRGEFPWERRVQIYRESLMVIALKQTKLWNGKRYSHGSGICRFSINQRREMHSIWKFRQILDIYADLFEWGKEVKNCSPSVASW